MNCANTIQASRLIELGGAVLRTEASAVMALIDRLDVHFVRACEYMLQCTGRIVVVGMGKSGHIASKIAATLASTGTPAFFVHPGEASHGDLGMIVPRDVVLALSNSGETEEILRILPLIKRQGVPLIAMTGKADSTLAREADVFLDTRVEREACPLGLAPTASTTAALALGDALAIALLDVRGFTAEDFALSHPGGNLGRRLLLHVSDIMHAGVAVPKVRLDAALTEALGEMTRGRLGMTAVVDAEDRPVGVFTDGDLRRALEAGRDLREELITQMMTRHCKTIGPQLLAVQALELMEKHKINGLLVVNSHGVLIGALNMHDLLRAGVV